MQIRDIMQPHVVTITPTTSIAEALREMHKHGIRHLPVVEGVSMAGMVSDRDLRDAFPSKAINLSQGEIWRQMDLLIIKTCMVRDVMTISPDDDAVWAACQFLDGLYSCLPVLERGRLVGMVTDIDLLKSFVNTAAPAGDLLPVQDYMNPNPYTVTSTTLVSTAYQRMLDTHIRHLPVIEQDGRLVGILTDRDVRQAHPSDHPYVAFYEQPELLQEMTVNDAMITEVMTVGEKTSIGEAGHLLLAQRFGCLPVIGPNQRLTGILTVSDLIRAYVAQHGDPS